MNIELTFLYNAMYAKAIRRHLIPDLADLAAQYIVSHTNVKDAYLAGDVMHWDKQPNKILLFAASSGELNVVKYLVSRGAK